MFKSRLVSKKGEKGFTLIELLVVAAIIGILLAIAIPNLIKARMSANEANARKAMQTLRDAEGEYFEQDLDNNGTRDYIDEIGNLTGTTPSLRDPEGTADEQDALVDSSFEGASDTGGADCSDPKAGYCIRWDAAVVANAAGLFDDFGWQSTMTSFNKVGRRDYAVYGDGVIRCDVSTSGVGQPGTFEVDRTDPGCD
ncbi:MAG TPA: prepilin-type N-terminal cleavage/methylation domain-containing protein [Thermodesulfobacteriota bacterium]|nr:prepilin-type N-terminal cleavage/methylation domain-containing protein [Thermodesulfobacteriota bacterium]